MNTINKTIGTNNSNALAFNVIVKQKSINEKDGVKLTSNFKANFDVFVNRYMSVGQMLNRILKGLNFQIVQGKQSGKFNGLNLRNEFMFEVYYDGNLLFKSEQNEFAAKCGLTEKSQTRFFRNFAKQFNKAYNEKTEYYINFTSEDDSLYTLEMDDAIFREVMNTNVCDMLENII